MHNVLDDVVDKEAGAKPKLVGPSASGGVGSAVRHLSQDELDAYVEGRLSGARLDFVRGHLDACEACRAELTDLRTFKASAVGMSQASSLKRELERRRRRRMLKTAAASAAAAAVVAVIGVVGWNKFGKAWMHTASTAHASGVVAASKPGDPSAQPRGAIPSAQRFGAAQVRGAPPTAVIQPQAEARAVGAGVVQAGATGQRRASMAAVSVPEARNASAVGAQASTTAQPHASGAAVAPTPSSPQLAAAGSNSFALLAPFGEEVTDDRPEFTWQPLEGATKYSIIIVDEGLRPIAHTRLKTTTWRPHKPLRRGRTYLWQVTAILKNGTKVMAKGPTSQEARIHVTAPAK